MHLSMVCPTSPTWGRWGNGGGFVLWILYFAQYMGHNYRVLPPSTPLSPYRIAPMSIVVHQKDQTNIDFQLFQLVHSLDKCPTFPNPWGQAATTCPPCLPHPCPRWGRWGILLIGALHQTADIIFGSQRTSICNHMNSRAILGNNCIRYVLEGY